MIISHQKKLILLAPWKTASTTINRRLQNYNESPYDGFYYFNTHLQRVVHRHLTCAEFNCLPESRGGYYLASFVRNPYDRVYSGFLQLKKDTQRQPLRSFPERWIKDLVMKQLGDNYAQLSSAGFDFDQWLHLVQEHQIYEIGRNTSFPLHPAHYWTHLAGNKMVDFVGRVESFEADFETLCSQFTLICEEKVNENVTNDVKAPSEPTGSKYLPLMAKASIDKINQLFKVDFDLFGYEKAPI